MLKFLKKYILVFVLVNTLSSIVSAAPLLVYSNPENADNCVPTTCSLTPCSDNGGTASNSCSLTGVDIITATFYKMISDGINMVPTKSTLGMPNTEGLYVTCDTTNDQLQSCVYGKQYSTTTDAGSATANPNLQAIVNGKPYTASDGTPVYCPLTRCDVSTKDIYATYSYNDITYDIKAVIDGELVPSPVPNLVGSGIGGFRAISVGSGNGEQACLMVQTPKGYAYLGCKSPPQPISPQSLGCSADVSHSRAFLSITGRLMECITNLINGYFDGNESMIVNLRNGVINIIRAALILYIILFGIKMMQSEEPVHFGDISMFFAKMILVIYFSVGFGGSNGMESYGYPLLKAAMSSFSEMVFSSANKSTDGSELCYFDPGHYESGYDYLALWDSIDCRVAYYLGFYSISSPGAIIANVFTLIFPMLLGGNILSIILVFCFGIFFLSVVAYFVHVYILSMLGLAAMTYMSPVFVPFALFESTKNYFDNWFKVIISFSLQPMVITAFLAVMLSVFDGIIFKGCTFASGYIGELKVWHITNPSDTTCSSSLGAMLANSNGMISSLNLLFFSVDIVGNAGWGSPFFKALLQVTIYTILFYFFAEKVGDIAAELTGGPDLNGLAISPHKIADAAAAKAKKKLLTKDKQEKDPQTNATTTDAQPPAGGGGAP